MKTEELAENLSALAECIDRAVFSVRRNMEGDRADLNILIRIAELAKEYARSADNDTVSNSTFLQNLLNMVGAETAQISTRVDGISNTVSLSPTDSSNPLKMSFRNSKGKQIILGKCLGHGGEGSVYKIPSCPGKVAKVYSERFLNHDIAKTIKEKTRYLIRKQNASYIGDTLIAAFPEEVLLSSDGSFAGYIMPQITTSVKLYDVQREGLRRKLFPDLNYRGLIAIAYNLAETVSHLHKHGIIVGDLNQNNILVHADGTIVLIDCNSFDLTDSQTGIHYPCTVGLQELLAPELQTVSKLSNATFTKESDCFSLAIHIFRLLMNNADPFNSQVINNCKSSISVVNSGNSIVRGECVYVRDIPDRRIPKWSPALTILPEDLQKLFQRAFTYTAETVFESISRRPTAREWMEALKRFYQMPLMRCKQDPFHMYLPSLHECPFCQKPEDRNKS